jgi:PilZ domain
MTREQIHAMLNSRRETPARSASPAQNDPKSMRRSSRLTIDIPVEVICKGPQNTVHTEETRTFVVSAHGCALSLKTAAVPGETIVLIHKMSREEISCRVVMCRQAKSGSWDTGVEFRSPSRNFWHIAFPPDDWDPAFRDHNAAAPVKK